MSFGFRFLGCLYFLSTALVAKEIPVASEVGKKDLWSLTFEELLEVKVSTASRQEDSYWKANASVSILMERDLIDFSRMTLAEGLRQVEGVDVGRVSASTWAISSRGLVGEFSNRQLVLVDDRQMYSSLFGGVNWAAVDTFLPDLKQVEIVRGAGGSAWGSNAVHGVINAISKPADETLGGLFYGTIGEGGHQFGVRLGGELADNTFGRVFVKQGEFDSSSDSQGQELGDEWEAERAEFRIDHYGEDWNYIFQGGGFRNTRGQTFLVSSEQPPYFDVVTDDIRESGFFLRANGKSDPAFGGKDVEWNVYLDDTRSAPFVVNEHRRSWNGFLSFREEIGRNWDGIVSLDTRFLEVENVDSQFVRNRSNFFSAWNHGLNLRALIEKETGISGSVGTRLEYNSDIGLVALPSARIGYELSERSRVWGSYTRAARFPDEEKTRIQTQTRYFPAGYFGADTSEVFQVSRPNLNLSEEIYDVFEVGTRVGVGDRLQLAGSIFHESMEDVIQRVVGPVDLSTDPGFQYIDKLNAIEGEIYGWEATARFEVNENLQLRAFCGTIRHSSSLDGRLSEIRNYARYHGLLETKARLSEKLNLSVFARYFDARRTAGIDSWLWLDASLSYRFGDDSVLTLSGENLLEEDRHEIVNFNRFDWSHFSSNWKLSLQLPF